MVGMGCTLSDTPPGRKCLPARPGACNLHHTLDLCAAHPCSPASQRRKVEGMTRPTDLNRRDFTKWAAAALGGLVAGAGLAKAADAEPKKKDVNKPLLLQEPHVCRGLNTCKGLGKGGKNDCAGQGACATAESHTCGGDNACAGLGGCG